MHLQLCCRCRSRKVYAGCALLVFRRQEPIFQVGGCTHSVHAQHCSLVLMDCVDDCVDCVYGCVDGWIVVPSSLMVLLC